MKDRASYDLAFIDLDDTLLGPDKKISSENLEALDLLRGAGVEIVVASGRHHRNIASFTQIGKQGWILSSHGAVVRHEQTGEVIHRMTMDPVLMAEVSQRGRDRNMSLIAYHLDDAYIEGDTRWTQKYAREAGWQPRIVDFHGLAPDGFQKIIWSTEPKRIDEVAAGLIEEFRNRLYVVGTNPELLEFLAPAVNKAAGARALANKLGVPFERTLAFGDGHNDIEMLQWAGRSVAMAHGRERAREAAQFVSPAGPPETAFARAVDLALRA